jgi:hypothetical protein
VYKAFDGKAQRKETIRKTGGIDGRMGSEWILRRLAGGVDWIKLAQEKDRWRALVNAVMNLRIPASRS